MDGYFLCGSFERPEKMNLLSARSQWEINTRPRIAKNLTIPLRNLFAAATFILQTSPLTATIPLSMKVTDQPDLELSSSASFDRAILRPAPTRLEGIKRLWGQAQPVLGLLLFAGALASVAAWFIHATPK
jgi:hypothetical protein